MLRHQLTVSTNEAAVQSRVLDTRINSSPLPWSRGPLLVTQRSETGVGGWWRSQNVNRRFTVLFVVCWRPGLKYLMLASNPNPLRSPRDWLWISDLPGL